LTVQAGCIVGGGVDELGPFPAVLVQFRLSQKVGRLQDGFERVAQIVRQTAKVTVDVVRALCIPPGQFTYAIVLHNRLMLPTRNLVRLFDARSGHHEKRSSCSSVLQTNLV